jgi:hypothetical protein
LDFNAKGTSNVGYYLESYVSLTSLNTTNIGPVAIRSFGKLLLCPSLLQSKLTDSLAQALLG